MVGLTRHVRALGRTHGKCCWCAAALATFKWDQWIPRYLTNILKRTVSANVCALTVDRLLTRCRDNLRRTWYHYCRRWQYMPGFTAHNYCRGDIHIKSRHCPPKSDHPRIMYTRHTHDLTYDIPSHRTEYRQKIFFPRTIPEWNSLPQEWPQHPLLCDQGLLPTRPLTSINEKWVSEGWSCAGRGSPWGPLR